MTSLAAALAPILLIFAWFFRRKNVLVYDEQKRILKKPKVKAQDGTHIDLTGLQAEVFHIKFKRPAQFHEVTLIIKYNEEHQSITLPHEVSSIEFQPDEA